MTHPVFDIEAARCSALERNDLVAAQAVLADDLVYVHSLGIAHNKAELHDFLKTSIRYVSVKRRNVVLHGDDPGAGDVVWTTGLMKMQATRLPGGETLGGVSLVTQVWTRKSGAWLLSVLHATRADDALWPAD